MNNYKMKTGKIGNKVIDAYKNAEEKFVETFLEENGNIKTAIRWLKIYNAKKIIILSM